MLRICNVIQPILQAALTLVENTTIETSDLITFLTGLTFTQIKIRSGFPESHRLDSSCNNGFQPVACCYASAKQPRKSNQSHKSHKSYLSRFFREFRQHITSHPTPYSQPTPKTNNPSFLLPTHILPVATNKEMPATPENPGESMPYPMQYHREYNTNPND